MAILFFQVTSLSRGAGRSAPAAAAYRSGERLRDERAGVVHNHAHRRDIEHRDILLPTDRAANAPEWTRDREQLWNAAEWSETRRNARVATEYLVALPHELNRAARTELARRFAQTIADRYGTPVDLSTHEPRTAGDPRNFHAHLLATTRVLTPEGLGPKTNLSLADTARRQMGLLPMREELTALRADWAAHANGALKDAGLEANLDPRTLRAQGLTRPPVAHLPMAVVQLERRGVATQLVRELRAAGVPLPATVRERTPELAGGDPARRLTIDELQAQSRERWLALRATGQAMGADARGGPERARERDAARAGALEWGD